MPKSEPNGTKQNQNQKNKISIIEPEYDPYEGLEEKYKTAIELRLRNISYPDIAKFTNTPLSTVKKWFMKGGLLDEAWQFVCKIREVDRAERRKELDRQLEDAGSEAVAILLSIMRGEQKAGAMAKIVASKTVLEYGDYRPPVKVVVDEDSPELKLFKKAMADYEGLYKHKSPIRERVQNKRKSRSLDTKTKGDRGSNTISKK